MSCNPVIRPERPTDIKDIFHITELAFRFHPHSRNTEQFIIEELRRSGALSISLVAEVDGQVAGHIAFSPVEISDGSMNWYILGPVSVTPELQGQGIGRALITDGLAALQNIGAAGCVLVGYPAFYERFGFRNHPDCIFEGIPQEYFLLLAFDGHPATGKVTHHPAFNAQG